ncbi:hypothetical protein [Pyxidicoccus sp. MSG2]|uniref:hypothetical protein n=1 Tax=Pyxidicoccus sp. MSG2 TaxID=2996790 RepID=UPI00226EAAC6|nr:hypothetical protein [Pyxidicoccus sp. MSG2]MCY1016219.1 hypothetical protein [Pyxidicoccus sp. MSG2]
MITLPLADIETAVVNAFASYLSQDPHSFNLTLSGHTVRVDIELRDDRFDCGIPGYVMANANVPALRDWVPDHITAAGGTYVGGLAPCKTVGGRGQVNVVLRTQNVMFNFHVNLEHDCG